MSTANIFDAIFDIPCAERERRLKPFLSYQSMLSLPRPSWRIEGMVRARGITYIKAPPKSGKTFLAIDMAARVSLGWPLLSGNRTTRCRVLYLCAEDIEDVAERIQAWALYYGVRDLPDLFFYPEPLHLVSDMPEFIEDILEDLGKVGVVIVDTQAACSRGINESDKAAWDAVFCALEEATRRLDCGIWIVHHAGLSGRLRGTTDMEATAMTVMALEMSESRDSIMLSCELMRGKPFAPQTFRIAQQEMPYSDRYGNAVSAGVLVAADADSAWQPTSTPSPSSEHKHSMLMALADRPLSLHAWRMAASTPANLFNRYVRELLDSGAILLEDGIYRIA